MSETKLKGLLNRQALTHCIQFQFASHDEVEYEQPSSSECVAVLQDTTLPANIQKLLDLYEDVFQTPTSLPPPRPFDH